MFKKLDKIKVYLPILIFLLAFIWRLWGIDAQGETWDEIAYYNAGHSYLANIKHGDFNAEHWDANKEHPPLAKYLYAVVSIKPYTQDVINYDYGRVLSAFMGALTVLIVFYLMKDLFSNRYGVIAALILTFMPILVGLNKVFGLDTPTVLFYTLTIYLFISAITKNKHKLYLLTALSLGAAIATRYNNFILFALLPVIFLILKGYDIWQGKDRKLLWYILIIPIIALLFLFISWPWLWSDTIAHWQATIGHWGSIKELFLGVVQTPSSNYYFIYLLITTPALILFLCIFFFINLLKTKNKYLLVILVWFLSLFLVGFSPTKQNGMRYIAAIYPPLSMMAAIGFFMVLKSDKKITIATVILLLYLMISDLLVHPYYLTYYNEIIGGPRHVINSKLFPVGWWGEGVGEACLWVSNQAKNQAKIFVNSIPNHTTNGKIRNDLIKTDDDPDYIITNLNKMWRDNYEVPANYRLVHTINSAGAPFVFIYEKQ